MFNSHKNLSNLIIYVSYEYNAKEVVLLMKSLYSALLFIFVVSILTHSKLSLYYATLGLTLWSEKMIPALLPFMILSGIMIRMNLTEIFVRLIYPVIHPLYRISRSVCYGMFMGFLCGFPMGAKTASDLLKKGLITSKEASYLLAFCNNIGPVYFISFALPLLKRTAILPYLFGMYGIPLLYGIVLRYTAYSDLSDTDKPQRPTNMTCGCGILEILDEAINSALQSILILGGYMILFNLMNLLPHLLLGSVPTRIAPLMEITGGMKLSEGRYPFYSLIALAFGGCSCIAQTNSCIRNTELSLKSYLGHKIILTGLTVIYYLGWRLFFPETFLL